MYKTSKVVNWQMLQNSGKPGFQFLLIRSGINMSALCLPASCCRSQIFLQYFNSHFFWKHLPSLIWKYFGSKSTSFQITILTDFLFLFDNLSKWVFSPGSLCLTAGKRQRRRRRRKKRKKRWRRRRKVDTKHNFTTLFSPTWTAASPAQILSFTFQINMKNFTFLNLPRKSVDEQCSGVEWGLCIESNRVATQTVKYHPNLQNRT